MRIGIFDSGIGGLNVLKEIYKKYPNHDYIYYGDTLHVPYGDKSKDELLKLSTRIIRFFENRGVDLIIIACGTISSTCALELKKISSIPIVDIITPTINYLKTLTSNKILLFATRRTIESHIFKNSIPKIQEVFTPEFVFMIESREINLDLIKKYIEPYLDTEVLVLGCTHYPLLINEFKKFLNPEVLIVDMGVILANTIKLKEDSKANISLYFTKIDHNLIANIKQIINSNYEIKEIND